jgi:glycine/D-amino acid oxidase-like deaminating enzyme
MRWVLRRWEASEGVPEEFDALVDARGVGARQDLQGLGIPLNINQGEVLTLGPGVWNEPWGLNRVHWLLPVGGGRSRLGATYRWDLEENRVHPEVAQSLLAAVEGARLEPFPPGAVEEHVSGLRPVAPDRRPILGLVGDKHWIFNGLGTRGVMVAPRAAEFLAGQIHSNPAEPTSPYASPFRWRDRSFK